MTTRFFLLTIFVSLSLAACTDVPQPGFLTAMFTDDEAAPEAANACTSNSNCPQAPGFCVARGYRPDTDGYRRCLVSVEENIRKQQR